MPSAMLAALLRIESILALSSDPAVSDEITVVIVLSRSCIRV